MRFHMLCALLCLLAGSAAAQQIQVGDPLEDYARLLQLEGAVPSFSFAVRPLSARTLLGEVEPEHVHPWQELLGRYQRPLSPGWLRLGAYDPEVQTFWNSGRPAGQNDGAVWQGRGGTIAVSAGTFARASVLSVSFRPRLIYNQNRAFPLWPGTTYNEAPGHVNLDRPQRFGRAPFSTFDLGQSYVRLDVLGLAAGLSNEDHWWGPARQNAIILSNNAPGFPHAFVGTSGPVDVWVGDFHVQWLWGRLEESGYFEDPRKRSDERFITGAVLDIAPRGFDGLSIGLARMFVRTVYTDAVNQARRPLTSRDYFIIFQSPFKLFTGGQDRFGFDEYDQLASVYARWLFPESGFEIYGEYARGDHNSEARDFIVHLQHAGAYTAGFQKSFELATHQRLRLEVELTRLEAPRAELSRAPTGTFFYINTTVRQGYTQRGQIMGAGIGPGSNSQYVGLDFFAPWGRAGGFVRRVAYDNDQFHALSDVSSSQHEIELSSGIRGLLFYGGFELDATLTVGRLLNQFYQFENDHSNVNLTLSLRRELIGYR